MEVWLILPQTHDLKGSGRFGFCFLNLDCESSVHLLEAQIQSTVSWCLSVFACKSSPENPGRICFELDVICESTVAGSSGLCQIPGQNECI